MMDKYDEHKPDFEEALKGHKRVQLLLPFDRKIEAMNKEALRLLERKVGVHPVECGCAACNVED